MKKFRWVAGICAVVGTISPIAILSSCSCNTGDKPTPPGPGPKPPTPEIKPIPDSEYIVQNGIVMGLKRDWSEYYGYTQILIPSSIKSINTDALASNEENGYMPSTITNLTFEEDTNDDNGTLVINDGAFANDIYLETIVFPQRTQYIGADAFANCKNVKTLDFSSWTEKRAKDVNPFANPGIFYNWSTSGKVITKSETVRDSLYYMLTTENSGLTKKWFQGVKVQPNEITDGDIKINYDIVNNEYAVITGLTHTTTTLVENWIIPSKINSFDVLGIAPFAAKNFTNVKKLSINADSTLSDIGARAFDGCDDIEEIDFTYPNTIYEGSLELIDTCAFSNLPKLTKVKVPNCLQSIGSFCFENDKLLKTIDISGTLVQKIMPGTFYNCESIENLNFLGLRVSWIGSYAFALSSPSEKGMNSFRSLKGLVYIGDNAFEYQNFTNVELKTDLVYLGDFAFRNCKNLTSLKFASCLGYFGAGAIAYTNVQSIECNDDHEKEMNYATPDKASPTITTVDKTKIICAADMWEIPTMLYSTVNAFAPYAFAGTKTRNDALDWSQFNLLTTIGDWAFAGLKATAEYVVQIKFPNNIISIGDHVFSRSDVGIELFNDIANLQYLSYWGDYLFSNCEKLEAYNTEQTPAVTRIPEGTFSQSGLKTLCIKKNIEYIDDQAFGQCTSLQEIDVSDFDYVPLTWYKIDEKPFDFTLTHNLTVKIKDETMQNIWKELLLSLGIKETDQYKLVFVQ